MRRVSRLGSASVLFLLAACGGGGDGGTGPGGGGGGGGGGNCAANTFCMTAGTFNPTTRTVAVNTAVTWTNGSGTGHNVTFADAPSALGVGAGAAGNFDAPAGSSDQRRFAAAGTYTFHCAIHGTGMSGSVVVQ